MAEGKLNDLNLGQFNRLWGRLCLYPDRGEGGLVLPRSPWHGGLERLPYWSTFNYIRRRWQLL